MQLITEQILVIYVGGVRRSPTQVLTRVTCDQRPPTQVLTRVTCDQRPPTQVLTRVTRGQHAEK